MASRIAPTSTNYFKIGQYIAASRRGRGLPATTSSSRARKPAAPGLFSTRRAMPVTTASAARRNMNTLAWNWWAEASVASEAARFPRQIPTGVFPTSPMSDPRNWWVAAEEAMSATVEASSATTRFSGLASFMA